MPHDNFYAQFPHSTELGLKPVVTPYGAEHEGYDIDEVRAALGDKFVALQSYLADKSVFVCGHRIAPHTVTDEQGKSYTTDAEVHCVYAKDLEHFLTEEASRG